jgi:hypothetical protein
MMHKTAMIMTGLTSLQRLAVFRREVNILSSCAWRPNSLQTVLSSCEFREHKNKIVLASCYSSCLSNQAAARPIPKIRVQEKDREISWVRRRRYCSSTAAATG